MKRRTLSAKAAWYAPIMDGGEASEITFANDTLTVIDRSGKPVARLSPKDIERLAIKEGPLRNGFTIGTKAGRTIKIGALQKKESRQIRQAIEERILELRAEEGRRLDREAAGRAKYLKAEIISLDKELADGLSNSRYTRHSESREMRNAIKRLTDQCDARLRAHLDRKTSSALANIDPMNDSGAFEDIRAKGNLEFTEKETATVKATTDDLVAHRLTDEQANAIATDEDTTLVLAGAGTGKTSVITGKIAHLVRNQGVPPGSILALAFNRDAANEIRDRLAEDLKGAQVSTFHSFAIRVTGEATGEAPTVSKLATDDIAYGRAIDEILSELMMDDEIAPAVIVLLTSEYAEYTAPFRFTSYKAYREYVRTTEPRSLNGELVKSMEELTIANFLAMNGVAYEYEKDYRFPTATREHRQYQPDFYLPDYDVYIEHFAVDEQGNPPEEWTDYADGMRWKRVLHGQNNTKLIETCSWERTKDILLYNLERKLRDHGVCFHQMSKEEMIQRLSRTRIRRLARLIGTFLNHVKSSDLTDTEIVSRAQRQDDQSRTKRFVEVARAARKRYEARLLAERTKDFHDLINEATGLIEKGEWQSPFTYVLIDEFQDISNGRMNLAKVLKKQGVAYFLVGDDWQSIYRFAGSYVGLIHQCDQHLGHTQRINLTHTFRFGDGIAKPSSGFIQQNPEQTKRNLLTNGKCEDNGITVIANESVAEGLTQALKEIERVRVTPQESVKVLGRYRRSVNTLREQTKRVYPKIEFSTIHRTKGLEADHVVVMDLNDDRHYGFPSQMEDDPLLGIVMPPMHGEPFPFAEERRLFYVALTRARKGVYLITDPDRPSVFIRELTRDYPQINQQGSIRLKCTGCRIGSMIPSQTGDNLRCTNYPVCRHMLPRCPGCKCGYAMMDEAGIGSVCTNNDCDSPPEVCPNCKLGVLIVKRGRTTFWGCSRYWDDPSCGFTKPAMGIL